MANDTTGAHTHEQHAHKRTRTNARTHTHTSDAYRFFFAWWRSWYAETAPQGRSGAISDDFHTRKSPLSVGFPDPTPQNPSVLRPSVALLIGVPSAGSPLTHTRTHTQAIPGYESYDLGRCLVPNLSMVLVLMYSNYYMVGRQLYSSYMVRHQWLR
jgi:hypothetical protein